MVVFSENVGRQDRRRVGSVPLSPLLGCNFIASRISYLPNKELLEKSQDFYYSAVLESSASWYMTVCNDALPAQCSVILFFQSLMS